MEQDIYYIFSIEHRLWWKPNACGYTHILEHAGKYTFEEASAIIKSANLGGTINETMININSNLLSDSPSEYTINKILSLLINPHIT
jgi:hypothetical protein